jgi:eukaryotic-like serine/threonine-protein kinase
MQHAPRLDQPSAKGQTQPAQALRSEMERRRAQGRAFSIKEAVNIIVPLCLEAAQRHDRGERLFLHPSCIVLTGTGQLQIAAELASSPPSMERDRACLAPEEKHGQSGDSRASVFTIGAIFYELLTNELVGPAMPRPTQVVPGLHPAVEVILGKALVTDRAHRPDDLRALAQALHHVVPSETVPPPADESHLDQGADFAVDVSLSMLPPDPSPGGVPAAAANHAGAMAAPKVVIADHHAPDPYAMAVVHAPRAVARGADPTAQLANVKARLEADPRPRYVVIKEGMDHGPFNAVELLQQIGSHAFARDHILRDTLSGDEKPIEEWKEFAPFAEHAKINREIVAEKKAIEQVVVAEAKGTRAKTLIGIGALAILLAGIAGWYVRARGLRNDAIRLAAEQGISVDAAGGLKGQQRKNAARAGGGSGGPVIPSGLSCEGARAKYIEEISMGGPKGPADLTAGQFASVLNNGSYIVACGTPGSMKVTVCAAVQNGRAVGVTVTTEPHNGGISSCIASRVRAMSFPSNPKLDIATTRF